MSVAAPAIGNLPPLGTRLNPPAIPPDLPPDLVAALHAAKESGGRYMVAVWIHDGDERGTINMHLTRGGGWSYDWLLRSLNQLKAMIFEVEPPKADLPPLPASENK